MIIDETHIGEYTEDDFRHKGVVFEAETEADAALIDILLNNKEQALELLKDKFMIIPHENPSLFHKLNSPSDTGLIMTVNGRDWIDYNREVHSQMTALGFKIEIKNLDNE